MLVSLRNRLAAAINMASDLLPLLILFHVGVCDVLYVVRDEKFGSALPFVRHDPSLPVEIEDWTQMIKIIKSK